MDDNKSLGIDDSGDTKIGEGNNFTPTSDIVVPKQDNSADAEDGGVPVSVTVDSSTSQDKTYEDNPTLAKDEGEKEFNTNPDDNENIPSMDNTPDQVKPQDSNPVSVDNKLTDSSTPKHKKPIGVIVVAVLVALGLAGLSVYMYMKNQPEPIDNNAATADPTDEKNTEATPESVDDATQEIDESMDSLDDNTDFSESELSDDTLGL